MLIATIQDFKLQNYAIQTKGLYKRVGITGSSKNALSDAMRIRASRLKFSLTHFREDSGGEGCVWRNCRRGKLAIDRQYNAISPGRITSSVRKLKNVAQAHFFLDMPLLEGEGFTRAGWAPFRSLKKKYGQIKRDAPE